MEGFENTIGLVRKDKKDKMNVAYEVFMKYVNDTEPQKIVQTDFLQFDRTGKINKNTKMFKGGYTVEDLHKDLKKLGYAHVGNDERDKVFGISTLKSVLHFQVITDKVTVSGQIGDLTVEKFKKIFALEEKYKLNSKNPKEFDFGKPIFRVGMNCIQDRLSEIDCIARILYGETGYARKNEKLSDGVKAVAQVIKNRIIKKTGFIGNNKEHPELFNDARDVIFKYMAFQPAREGGKGGAVPDRTSEKWELSISIALNFYKTNQFFAFGKNKKYDICYNFVASSNPDDEQEHLDGDEQLVCGNKFYWNLIEKK